MKKILGAGITLAMILLVLTGCEGTNQEASNQEENQTNETNQPLSVMVTMFAQYDFARQIGGDYVTVQRLVDPGVDIHTFDPLPQDILAINQSELFIYTGAEMEPWVHRILDSLDVDELVVLDVSTGIDFLPWYGDHDHDHHGHDHHEDEHHHHDYDHHEDEHHDHDHDHHEDEHHDHEHDHHEDEHHDHDHDHHEDEHHDHDHDHHEDEHHDHDHDHHEDEHHDHDHDHHEDEHHDHEHDHHGHDHHHDVDPHIWTSPLNGVIMVQNIQEALTLLLPEHAQYFEENAAALIEELLALDADFRTMVAEANRTTIYHGGRFALHYLMHEYGIEFVSSAMETDPADNPLLLAQMITEINEQQIPVIFHEELVNPYTANMIAEETGAQLLLLHTIHNVSIDEIAAGETYVSLMRQNLEHLRMALD